MFVGGLFAMMIKLLPWLLLAIAVVGDSVDKIRQNDRLPQ